MAFFEVNDIRKNFGSLEVLKGISFSMEKGEVLAIIGSSGSGKTTLLRCINFLEWADSGRISINGELLLDEENKNEKEDDIRLKRLHFGLVFQNFNLFPQYSVIQNISLAPNLLAKDLIANKKKELKECAKQKGLGKFNSKRYVIKEAALYKAKLLCENKNNALRILDRVGLTDKMNAYPHELSGGQQQRVAIARALALQPDILCFDEPTSALDPELTGEVLKVIKGLKDSDSTMIVVTHEMEFAKNVADKIIFMADGVIVEQGAPEDVIDNPKNDKTKAFLQKSKEMF